MNDPTQIIDNRHGFFFLFYRWFSISFLLSISLNSTFTSHNHIFLILAIFKCIVGELNRSILNVCCSLLFNALFFYSRQCFKWHTDRSPQQKIFDFIYSVHVNSKVNELSLVDFTSFWQTVNSFCGSNDKFLLNAKQNSYFFYFGFQFRVFEIFFWFETKQSANSVLGRLKERQINWKTPVAREK